MSVVVIDYQNQQAPQQFAAGLKKIGFAVIAHHPIDQKKIDEAYAIWGKFFHSTEKFQYAFDPKTHDGYISTDKSETAKGYNTKDLKEFFHYYSWGRCPASCLSITKQLMSELKEIAGTLLNWVQQCTPDHIKKNFSMPLPDMIQNSGRTLFRIIHYPPLTGQEPPGAIRAAAHEDINLLTLLPAATAEGLQVKDALGNWWDVPINPGWIIVNAGDMLQECSDDYYPSTTHRVLNPTGENSKKSRLAMPLFLHPRDEVILSSRHTAGSYCQERFEEIGLN